MIERGVILTLEVLPGSIDFLQDRQISLLMLGSGLIPCFFPIPMSCLAALSAIFESPDNSEFSTRERWMIDLSASEVFDLRALPLLLFPPIIPSKNTDCIGNRFADLFNWAGPIDGYEQAKFLIPFPEWPGLFEI